MEQIAEVIDTLDNLILSLGLNMPADIHVSGLRGALPELRDKLKAAYFDEGGENVWD